MDKEQKVLIMLKPKVKSFGFNKAEVKSIAAKIADNLALEEDATEEDVNAAVEASIDAVLPFLQLGQTQANRVIGTWKKSQNSDGDDEDGDDEDVKFKKASQKKVNNNEQNEVMKALLESVNAMKDEIASLKSAKATDGRKAKLESLLKDAGSYGKSIIKNFNRMKFETDDDFDEYFEEVEADLKIYTQERADEGLSHMGGIPPVGGGASKEVLTDDEVKALAAL